MLAKVNDGYVCKDAYPKCTKVVHHLCKIMPIDWRFECVYQGYGHIRVAHNARNIMKCKNRCNWAIRAFCTNFGKIDNNKTCEKRGFKMVKQLFD